MRLFFVFQICVPNYMKSAALRKCETIKLQLFCFFPAVTTQYGDP